MVLDDCFTYLTCFITSHLIIWWWAQIVMYLCDYASLESNSSSSCLSSTCYGAYLILNRKLSASTQQKLIWRVVWFVWLGKSFLAIDLIQKCLSPHNKIAFLIFHGLKPCFRNNQLTIYKSNHKTGAPHRACLFWCYKHLFSTHKLHSTSTKACFVIIV